MGFSAWCGLTALSTFGYLGLAFGLLLGCVDVEQGPKAKPLAQIGLRVDSAAIYRCDSCAFAVAYTRQVSGMVKPCPSCDWVYLKRPKHNRGDVAELSNQPVDPLIEQDAKQHGTEHLVLAATDSMSYWASASAGQRGAKKNLTAPGGDGL